MLGQLEHHKHCCQLS